MNSITHFWGLGSHKILDGDKDGSGFVSISNKKMSRGMPQLPDSVGGMSWATK
jgi:hypothetical protein